MTDSAARRRVFAEAADLPRFATKLETAHGADETRLSSFKTALLAEAKPEAERIRVDYIEKRRAAGHPFVVETQGEVCTLSGEHAIQMTGGSWFSVDEILAEPARFHNQTCTDPLEPEYGGDNRLARIFSNQANPLINSFAHGGTVYPMQQSAQAVFAVVEASAAPVTLATEGERIAAITGQPFRVLFLESATIPDGELRNRLTALQAAESIEDPLSSLFHSTVIASAGGLPGVPPLAVQGCVQGWAQKGCESPVGTPHPMRISPAKRGRFAKGSAP